MILYGKVTKIPSRHQESAGNSVHLWYLEDFNFMWSKVLGEVVTGEEGAWGGSWRVGGTLVEGGLLSGGASGQ